MLGNKKNVFNSNTQKKLQDNKTKSMLDDRNPQPSQNKIIYDSAIKINYLFGTQDDIVINDNNSVVLSNTNTKKRYKYNYNDKKQNINIKNSLQILNNENFFTALTENQNMENVKLTPIDLYYENMNNIKSNSSISYMEDVYKNFKSLKEKEDSLLIVFDVETLGDITNKAWSPQGITEFAMITNNMTTGEAKEINILLNSKDSGINHLENFTKIKNILELKNGLDILKENKDLYVTAQRYAMYGHDKTKIEFNEGLGYSQATDFAGKDSIRAGDIDLIEKGYKKIIKDAEKIKIDTETGLAQDVSETLKSIAFMTQQNKDKNAMIASYNGQSFDIPVLNKFVKNIYQQQINILNSKDKSSTDIENAKKALDSMIKMFGNNPGFELDEDYSFDAFSVIRAGVDILGENKVYGSTESGKNLLPKMGSHLYKQEHVIEAFYPKELLSGKAHNALFDTKMLGNIFLTNVEGSTHQMPLINWLMEGIEKEGIIGRVKDKDVSLINSNQYFMATQTDQLSYNGKQIFNFTKDSNGRIVTSSNHIIDKDGNIMHNSIIAENPIITKNQVYTIKNIQEIDMSTIDPALSQLAPEYGLNALYHMELEAVHGDKYEGTSHNSSINLIFNSKKEAEAWASSTFSLIGETNENGEFKLNEDSKDDYEIRKVNYGQVELDDIYDKGMSDYEKFQYLLNVNEENTIDRRVTNNFLFGDKSVSRIGSSLDLYDFLKENNLEHLSSIELAKLYYDKDYASNIGLSQDFVKDLKKHLTKNLGFETKIDGKKRKILLDSTARNALFAYDNVKDQTDFYDSLLKAAYNKIGVEYDSKKNWSSNFQDLNNYDKDNIFNAFNYIMDETNTYIALSLGKFNEEDIREIVINGKSITENTSYFKNAYDFKLDSSFYDDKKSVKINNFRKSSDNENIVTFDLNRENPRQSFLKKLLNEKFENVENMNESELITYRKSVFLDFINSVSEVDNKELFETYEFAALKSNMHNDEADFSLEENIELLQKGIERVKSENINAGISRNHLMPSSKVKDEIIEARKNLTQEQIMSISENISNFKNLNKNKKDIAHEVEYLLNNFYMPNKEDYLKEIGRDKVNERAATILYNHVYEQMKGAINEIFEVAGYTNSSIHYNKNDGTINLINNNRLISLDDFPKIVSERGVLKAKSNNQTFVLKHVLDITDTKDGKKTRSRTNLDLNFGKEGSLLNRIKRLDKKQEITLDDIKKEIGFTKIDFADSPTILNNTLADDYTGNNTVDFRGTDPLLTHIFNPEGQYRKKLQDLHDENKLSTPNTIKIMEDNLPKHPLKPGELSATLRSILNVDLPVILKDFAIDEDTEFIIENSNALGKETRITEGNRFLGNDIFPTVTNQLDNVAKPTLVSAGNSKWLKSSRIERTKKSYDGLLISGPIINSKKNMQRINFNVEETNIDYQNGFSHRQLYTGVLGVDDILYKEQKRVIDNYTKESMNDGEKKQIIDLYSRAALMVRDSLFEQAKIIDPVLFEGTVGEIPQDVKKIGNGLECIYALNKMIKENEIIKIAKDSKVVEMLDSIGEISIDEDGIIEYRKGKGTIVKSGELIIPYKSYGGTIENFSSPFRIGSLGFSIKDEFNNELSEEEITKIINSNVNKHSFGKNKYEDLRYFLSIFHKNPRYKMGFEVENVNKLESSKMYDNYTEKSMVNLPYAKTGEFDKSIEKYFKITNGKDFLHNTVLTEKAIDSYIEDVKRKHGIVKADKLLKEAGLTSIDQLKQKIKEESMTYRNMIFGPKGIFHNVSGVANDDVIKHRSEGGRLSSIIGQAISLVGKHSNDGKDNSESYEIGLKKVLDFINEGNGKYDFLSETSNASIKDIRQDYGIEDFAFLFNPKNQENDEFSYANIEKAKLLLKDLNETFLSKAPEEDKLYHEEIKVLVGENKFETVKDYYGSLYFYKNKDGEKIAIGSLGVVNKNQSIDSEFQSNLSKEYLDRKKSIRTLKDQLDELLKIEDKKTLKDKMDEAEKEGVKSVKRTSSNIEIKKLQDQINREVAIVNSMSEYSRPMKIDDQARNILSNSPLNAQTEKNINSFIKGENRPHYSALISELSDGLIQDNGKGILIDDSIKTDNVNKKLLDEIRGQITYDPLEEKLLTKEMLKEEQYAKYADLYNKVEGMGLKLGTQHAQIFYEGKQAYKAAQFNVSNSISVDTLINKYDFKYKKIEDYVSTMGRADNKVLESLLHEALVIDLGEEFHDKRFLAVPGLGRKTGSKEIRQPWHQSLVHLSKAYNEYQELEGMENERSVQLKSNILEISDKIKAQTDQIIKKGELLSDISKVKVNMPYSRTKLMSTMSDSLIKSPIAEEMKNEGEIISDISLASFRQKAMINGKTIASLEKGGIEKGGIFFNYRTASESEFQNAGYFDPKFMEETMGFKERKDSDGNIVDVRTQMREYLEKYGTMDISDRYPNIKDQSLYTEMVFLKSHSGDNINSVAGHTLLNINGDSDGDMLSTLFIEHKGTNFATYNRYRMDAEKYIKNDLKLSDSNMTPRDIEKRIKEQTLVLSGGKVSPDTYDLFRQKQMEMIYRAVENKNIIETELVPAYYKESKRNYKAMALSITEDGNATNLEAEVVGGKSVLGKVRLFAQDKHITSGFFVKNNEELSEHMKKAYDIYENSNLIENKDEYKYMESLKNVTSIHEFENEQSKVLDEVLSIYDIAKQKDPSLVSSGEYDAVEKSVLSRIRANSYVEAEISKAGKQSIGQINGLLYPIKQASEDLYGKEFINGKPNKMYNPLARQVISDMSEQIEQNIISYKTVQAAAGDDRLISFSDIMNEVRKNENFNTLPGENKDAFVEWTQKYMKDDVIEKMYGNLEKQELLTDSMKSNQKTYYEDLLKQGAIETEASSSSKIKVLSQAYAEHVDGLYNDKIGKANIDLNSNYSRRSGAVRKAKSIEYASGDSQSALVLSLISDSGIGKDAPPIVGSKKVFNDLDEIRSYADTVLQSNSKSVGSKMVEDVTKILDSTNSSGLAMGVLGLASGLLISGFASGNPLKNPKPEEIENSPKTEAMSVPDFFEKQGGYVTGNSQNGYILNIKADTNKGQRHMKRALKQAVRSTAGGAVSINMNFKSNNSGGYSDQDVEKLINSYI